MRKYPVVIVAIVIALLFAVSYGLFFLGYSKAAGLFSIVPWIVGGILYMLLVE